MRFFTIFQSPQNRARLCRRRDRAVRLPFTFHRTILINCDLGYYFFRASRPKSSSARTQYHLACSWALLSFLTCALALCTLPIGLPNDQIRMKHNWYEGGIEYPRKSLAFCISRWFELHHAKKFSARHSFLSHLLPHIRPNLHI